MATGHLIPELKCKYFTPQAKLKKTQTIFWTLLFQSENNLYQLFPWHNLFVSACCWALQPDLLKVKSWLFLFSFHLRALAFAFLPVLTRVKGMSRQQKFRFALCETLNVLFHCRKNSHRFQREGRRRTCTSLFWKSELPNANLRLAIDRYQFR